ncbi:hypothetical protein [Carnobacterium sp. TMP28]|uniref:hypothetical protein n=1 Tax=Carnobacterium sp. TMP28 TaxID=3397060 RepID=UPI0039DFBF94
MNEDLISFILEGFSNSELKKIILNKRIKIIGIREVNDKTRDIVLKNLKTKSNLFEIYKQWKNQKNNLVEQPEIKEFDIDQVINDINLGKLSSFRGLSNYLLTMIRIEGFEKVTYFWEANKESLEKTRVVNQIEIKNEEKRDNIIDSINKNYLKELEKLEKKQFKERIKWQTNESKMNKLIKQRENEISNLQNDKKNLQKKYANTLSELKQNLENNKKETKEISNLITQKERLQKEFEKLRMENNDLKQENIKKYEFIGELKDVNILNINEIKRLNFLIQKQKNDKFFLESTNGISEVEDKENQKKQDYIVNQENQSEHLLESTEQVRKEEYLGKMTEENTQKEKKKKKILVFGEIAGFNFKEDLFEVYTSSTMPEDMALFEEDNYEAIWLIKYRFVKKGQRGLVSKKFKKIIEINNFTELKGAYKNES